MLDVLFNVLPTVIVLGVLIFIHELGHFVCAKIAGVTVEKFSIGFGPVILKKEYGGTVYAISLIPLGGFVQMAGETLEDKKEDALEPTDFLAQSVKKRFAIVFAGPLMNYVLAFFFLVIVFLCGKPVVAPIIGGLVEDYPAQHAGLCAGDVIVEINGDKILSWDDIQTKINNATSRSVNVFVSRKDETLSFSLEPQVSVGQNIFGDSVEAKKIGVYPGEDVVYVKYGLFDSFKQAAIMTYSITMLTYESIFRLVSGRLSMKALGGPLGIVAVTSKTAKRGIVSLMQLTALISISLAIFNLLPIPVLDGGHMLFILCEVLLKKPVSFKMQERLSQVGFILLMALMVFVSWNDMVKLNVIEKIRDIIPFIH